MNIRKELLIISHQRGGGGGGGGSGGRVTWFLGSTERGSVAANSEQGGTLENGLLMRGKVISILQSRTEIR